MMEDFTALEGALMVLNLILLVGLITFVRLWRRAHDGWGDALQNARDALETSRQIHAKWGETLETLGRHSKRWDTFMRVVNGEMTVEEWQEQLAQYEFRDLMRENDVAEVPSSPRERV